MTARSSIGLRFLALALLIAGWIVLHCSLAETLGRADNIERSSERRHLGWVVAIPFLVLAVGVVFREPVGRHSKYRLFFVLSYALFAISAAWIGYPKARDIVGDPTPRTFDLVLRGTIVIVGWLSVPIWWISCTLDAPPRLPVPLGPMTIREAERVDQMPIRRAIACVLVILGGLSLTAVYCEWTKERPRREAQFQSHWHPDVLPHEAELGLPFAFLVLGMLLAPYGRGEFARLLLAYSLGLGAMIIAAFQALRILAEFRPAFVFIWPFGQEANATIAFGLMSWISWALGLCWGILWMLDGRAKPKGSERLNTTA
jgi:hypothetical protein